jgi:hypothetical protein
MLKKGAQLNWFDRVYALHPQAHAPGAGGRVEKGIAFDDATIGIAAGDSAHWRVLVQ